MTIHHISQPFDLTDMDWSAELWVACHDDDEQNARLAHHLWEDNGLDVSETFLDDLLPFLGLRLAIESVVTFAHMSNTQVMIMRTYVQASRQRLRKPWNFYLKQLKRPYQLSVNIIAKRYVSSALIMTA